MSRRYVSSELQNLFSLGNARTQNPRRLDCVGSPLTSYGDSSHRARVGMSDLLKQASRKPQLRRQRDGRASGGGAEGSPISRVPRTLP